MNGRRVWPGSGPLPVTLRTVSLGVSCVAVFPSAHSPGGETVSIDEAQAESLARTLYSSLNHYYYC